MNLYLIGSRETYVIVNWVSIEVREFVRRKCFTVSSFANSRDYRR